MKVAVCDDELKTTKDLSAKISAYVQNKNVVLEVNSYDSGEKLLEDIIKKETSFDVIFLDIKMKELNGIQTAKIIRETNADVMIIFVSALHEYVFDAFDVDAMQFLVKPVEISKLYLVLDKAMQKLNKVKNRTLIVYKDNETKRVTFHDLLYCEVLSHSVFVYEKDIINKYAGKIDSLEKELNEDFFRCHRSYIINLAWVKSYKNGFAYLPSGEKIPVSTRKHGHFLKAMLNYQRNEVR